MPDSRLLWVTCASPFNVRTSQAVVAAGHRALSAPALHVRAVGLVPPSEPTALVFTCRHGVLHHEPRTSWLTLPAFVAGDECATLARGRGYRDVRRGDGTAAELRNLILGSVSRFGHVVHFGARETSGSLAEELRSAGLSAELVTVYESVKATWEQLRSVHAALSFVDGIVVNSVGAAEVAAECVADARWHGVVFCRSAACMAPFAQLPGLLVEMPASPTEEALLGLVAAFRGWPPGLDLRALVAAPRPAPLRLVVSNERRTSRPRGPGNGPDGAPPAAA